MEKESRKLSNMLLIGLLAIVIVGGIRYSVIYTANIITSFPKSSNIEDYMRPGIDNKTDSGIGTKPLAVVSTAPEEMPSSIPTESLNYKVQIEPIGNPTDEIGIKPSHSSPLDWVVKPLNQIVTYLFELTQETPTIESSLGDNLNTGDLLNPFK